MGKRITLVSLLELDDINKINNLVKKLNKKLCKVPYGIDDNNRYEIDNLPFHLTIFATDKENESNLIELARKININRIKVEVDKINIMKGNNDSWVLYLSI